MGQGDGGRGNNRVQDPGKEKKLPQFSRSEKSIFPPPFIRTQGTGVPPKAQGPELPHPRGKEDLPQVGGVSTFPPRCLGDLRSPEKAPGLASAL